MRMTFSIAGLALLFALGCSSGAEPTETTKSSTGSGGTTSGSGGTGGGASCPSAGEAMVQVDSPTGKLAGTLQTPDGCGPYPLVLIYPGSGPTDRDGNNLPKLHTDAYKQLAAALAASGIASLRYDKRGVGGSLDALPPDLSSFTFDDEVGDAAEWAKTYVNDARFTGLTLAGHSEGSLFAIRVANQVPAAAVISLEGAGRNIGEVLREQLGKQLSAALMAEANQIIDALEAGMTVDDVPPELASVFHPTVQQYLISWMKYDPAEELAKLDQPILVVQGTHDIQVGVKDAQILAAANPKAQLSIIDGMCHTLKDAALTNAAQQAAYTDPTLPLDAKLVSDVLDFVKALPSSK